MAISDWRSFDTERSCSRHYSGSERKISVSLRRLFPQASFVGCADIKVSGTTSHSCRCQEGDIFAALPGSCVHGADYIQEAIENGVHSVLVAQPLPGVSVRQCIVQDVRGAYAELCSELHGRPARGMSIIGVTGTNGKTTVTWLVRSILETANKKTGLLGTIHYSDGKVVKNSRLTTPETGEFISWISSMVKGGMEAAAVELSSHALDQKRVAPGTLDVGIVTNVTQDHFDYHGSAQEYLKSKSEIVQCFKQGAKLILNADDSGCQEIRQLLSEKYNIITFGLNEPADVSAKIVGESLKGTRFQLRLDDQEIEVQIKLIGKHNVLNCLAAAAATRQLGLTIEQIKNGLEAISDVPGRMQRIKNNQNLDVFVDYAHTDDALKNSLECLRKQKKGRLICLIGAGGDRDRSKRPLIGQAASLADLPVITSDNPRSEHPRKIIEDILVGIQGVVPFIEPDREKAIAWVIQQAKPGDCILIAGKGHEQYQEINGEKKPFCDVEITQKYIGLLENEESNSITNHQHAA